MQYRRLGRTGLLVSELALGTMIFGEEGGRGTDAPTAGRMIDRYLDAGGNHIDLANVYAGGRAEEIVGEAVRGRREELVLATKLRWPMGQGPNQVGLSRHHVMNAVEASLSRMGTDRIDLLYMHGFDPYTPLDETLRAFDDLVAAGKVRYLGVSNFAAWQVMKAQGIAQHRGFTPLIAAQYQYSLVERDIEDEFPALFDSEGIGLVPWGPLGGGFLSGKYKAGDRPEGGGRIAETPDGYEESWDRRATERNWATLAEVEKVARAHGASMSQVALAWLMVRPTLASVILGARTPEQLEDNLGAAELRLSDDEMARLEEVSRPASRYPYRIVDQPAR
ncbi:aldo/keto reductase [Limimaricola sp. G21655-S1]|uniref:aldo/keto reductase n=1 Tax=Limimaricola sp. G21655-S1 TaxID=3014768 RepID=UPI0022AEDAD6|nr:aldo/keto reductase [Limimaricola sp. G21655-S1]MCZ4259601.1 aldo/keto reductase [Limimaricola sp. G21655-S1]